MLHRHLRIACLLLAGCTFSAAGQGHRTNPYAAFDRAAQIGLKGPQAVRDAIRDLEAETPKDAEILCLLAELMKRVGDYGAEERYREAVALAPEEPAYELFFADYLRNFRGAGRPQFPEAERHYWEAVRKLDQLPARLDWDDETERRVQRGLAALYQQDGFPVALKGPSFPSLNLRRPFLFLASFNRYRDSTEDFDGPDDVRDFTSEAAFSSSRFRLNRSLDLEERRDILRKRPQFETIERLRFRRGAWPVFDFSYRRRELSDAQIVNFFNPGVLADVTVEDVGVGVEKPFKWSPAADFFVRGDYRRGRRRGLIEFLPNAEETVDEFEGRIAVARFFGPDKATLDLNYTYQNIDPQPMGLVSRGRKIFGSRLSYQIFRPVPLLQPARREDAFLRRFATRGIDLFGGYFRDREDFGGVEVERRDVFFGFALQSLGPLDVTLQETVLVSEVSNDPAQRNSQYRTNLTVLYRLLDEERTPGLPPKSLGLRPAFFHLVFPVRYDATRDGLSYYENLRVGARVAGKLFTGGRRSVTFLFSGGFDYQRFLRLDRDLWQVDLSFNMGFR